MNCCACSGFCMHIGPHSYCLAHRPNGYSPQITYIPQTLTPLPKCEHCYCKPVPDQKDHKRCCNCGNKQKGKP